MFCTASLAVPAPANILIADDDEISARFLKRLLLREGHHVSVVTTADEVLAECASNPPDLVVIDLVAPRGHGFDVCRRLKDQPKTRFIPVVIVTSQNDRHERLAGIDAGADDFVSKPFDVMELHARIKSLVKLKRYTDELESAEAVILGLGATIEARDPTTQGHCERLVSYATSLGQSLGLDETRSRRPRARRVPPRHRQDRGPRRRAAEGRQARPAGDARHARASGRGRRALRRIAIAQQRAADRAAIITSGSMAADTRTASATRPFPCSRRSSASSTSTTR